MRGTEYVNLQFTLLFKYDLNQTYTKDFQVVNSGHLFVGPTTIHREYLPTHEVLSFDKLKLLFKSIHSFGLLPSQTVNGNREDIVSLELYAVTTLGEIRQIDTRYRAYIIKEQEIFDIEDYLTQCSVLETETPYFQFVFRSKYGQRFIFVEADQIGLIVG